MWQRYTIAAVLGLAAATLTVPSFAIEGEPFTLTVTSSTPGQELKFAGYVFLSYQGTKLVPLAQRTPYRLTGTTEVLNAIFRANDKGSKLTVDVTTRGGALVGHSTANAVIIGQSLESTALLVKPFNDGQ